MGVGRRASGRGRSKQESGFQFCEGLSTCSITSTSTGPLPALIFSPSCCGKAVRMDGNLIVGLLSGEVMDA